MQHAASVRTVLATVEEVLPKTGLAYLMDERQCCWGVTRCTPGVGIDALSPGQRVRLTIEEHDDFSVASGYAPLN